MQTSSARIPCGPVDATDRRAARQLLRDRRSALGVDARDAASAAIVARLRPLVDALAPRVIAAFWPMHDEPDLRPAFAHWIAAGIDVALPRVVAPDAPLEFGRWRDGATLAAGAHATRHPEPHDPVVPGLVLLPCLGFDRACFRLGYGGGYYDRTLAGLATVAAIGVAFDDCEVTGFEARPHDRPLDCVVTERRVLRRAC